MTKKEFQKLKNIATCLLVIAIVLSGVALLNDPTQTEALLARCFLLFSVGALLGMKG